MNGYALIFIVGALLLASNACARPCAAARCGYDGDREQRLAEMLAFRDVNPPSSNRPTR